MRKDRYVKRHFHKKSLTLVLALALSCVLLVCGVVGGTLAWLTDTSDEVTNVFTTSDIEVHLEETTSVYKMIPGFTIDKNPKAWVTENSEDCYLFVKIVESENKKFDDYMTYEIADGWQQLAGVDGVYYRICDAADEKGEQKAYGILKDDKVTVLTTVTKDMMNDIDGVVDVEDNSETSDVDERQNAIDAEEALRPTLTFTAYASQYWKQSGTAFTPQEAWGNVNS